MSTPLTIAVAELSLVEGERRTDPPEMAWVSTERGTLYVLVELSAPAELWDEISELLVESAVEGFLLADSSDSLAMKKATEAANRALQLENEELSRDDQAWAGLNMALLRDDSSDLYLSQAGPALTYLARDERYKQFPPADDATDPRTSPLGDTGQPRVRLAKFSLEPNDIIVLSATHLPQIVSTDEQMRVAITTGDADEVANSLADLASGHDYSALILHPTVARQQRHQSTASQPELPLSTMDAEPAPPPTRESTPSPEDDDAWWYGDVLEQEEANIEEEDVASDTDADPPSPNGAPTAASQHEREPASAQSQSASTSRQRSPAQRETPRARRDTSTAKQTQPAEQSSVPRRRSIRPRRSTSQQSQQRSIDLERVIATVQSWANAISRRARRLWQRMSLGPVKRAFALVGAFLLLLLAGLLRLVEYGLQGYSRYVLPALRRLIPLLDRLAIVMLASLKWGWRRFISIMRHLLPGVSPAEDDGTGALNMPEPSEDGAALFPVLAVLIPLVILLAAGGWYWRSSGVDSERYNQLIADVDTSITQAEQANRDAALILLQGVDDELAEAADMRPKADEVQALRSRYDAVLEQVAKVKRIPATLIAPISVEAEPADIALQNGTLYVLDRGTGNVYTVDPNTPQSEPLDTAGAPLMGPGRPASGPIYFITRMPPGDSRTEPAIVGLTADGVVEYSESGGVRNLQFAPINGSIVAIDHYAGNLYLLDRQNGQIWKYVPDAAGEYSQSPEGWIEDSVRENLGTLAEFAIDGDIYVIDDAGTVTKLTVGERRPFTLETPVPAIEMPIALYSDEQSPDEPLKYLYIAEPNRILIYDKSGALLVQYRAPAEEDWGTIHEIVADEPNQVLYMLTSQGVFSLPLDLSP